MDAQKVKEDYIANLKPAEYNKEMNTILELEPEAEIFILTNLHNLAQSGKFSGTKLLEIGSGATVHSLASLSVQFTNIVQSDLVEENLEELRKWYKGESALDWTGHFNIAAKLHGYEKNLEEGRKFLEQRIRECVKKAVRSDVLTDEVIPMEELTEPNVAPPYDLITTAFCLDAAATSVEEFARMLKRLNNLLRVGGGLVLVGLENGSLWKCCDKTFFQLRITTQEFLDSFRAAGFGNVEYKIHEKGSSKYYIPYDNIIFIVAEKL